MTRTAARLLGFCLGVAIALGGGVHADNLDSVRATVEQWRQAWQARDLGRYMAYYHPRFQSNGLDRKRWRNRKASLFKRSGPLSIAVADLWVVMEKGCAVARFLQVYRSRDLNQTGEKTLVMVHTGDDWRIVEEKWRPLSDEQIPHRLAASDPPPTPPGGKAPLPAETAGDGGGPLAFIRTVDSDVLIVKLERFFIPVISTIDGKRPRIILDIRGVSRWSQPPAMAVDGNWVRRIRSYLHPETTKRLRIVLDLNQDGGLALRQTYIDDENIYRLEICQDKTTSSPPNRSSEDIADP